MQTESKYTKWKVIGGYILLFLLSILSTVLIYKQTTKLVVNESYTGNANQKLFIIGNTITGLYEAEALSNAFIQTGSGKYFKKYIQLLEETETNIDSLKVLTTRVDQQNRIDSIGILLEEKVRNLQDLVQVKQSFVPDDFYNKAIASILSSRDSIQEKINIQKRHITTLDSSYIKSDRKKRRWFFFKAQPDSLLKVSITHHTVIDTIDNPVPGTNTDSVVNILKATWEDVQKQTQDIYKRINQKEYALIQQSTYITDQLKRTLQEYEREEISHAFYKQQKREETITNMIRIFAWIAVLAFLSILFFTIFILRDLSRSQRYRRELESANRYADRLLKSKEKMILTVTHDIKSPLSSVIGYIELLNNTPIDDRQRYFLKNMKGSSEHILKLIGNLLDFSKLENNKMSLEEVVFNPAQLFQEILDNFMPLASAKHLQLNGKIGEDLNADYKGDALRFRQVITNILSNAIKYTTQGSIGFSAVKFTNADKINIRIQDTGSGMTAEEQKVIFEEFTRLSSHTAIEGTGLGLTITLKLIHLLNGEIHLQSKPGQGSCFTIILPLQQMPLSAQQVNPTNRSSVPSPIFPKSLKILLVDDDPLQLEMTKNLLENHAIRSETTTHPQEVLVRLANEPYDLIISDIQMPEMNGFDLVERIRHLGVSYAKTIPIVALSADSEKTESDYIKAGFTAYLNKPFCSDELIELISKLLGISYPKTAKTELPIPTGDAVASPHHLYTLRHILQFTDNDPEALKKILVSHIAATSQHLDQWKQYVETKEWDALSRLAHKMLPMFRQLEAQQIVESLEQIERLSRISLSEARIIALTEKMTLTIKELIDDLKKHTAHSIE